MPLGRKEKSFHGAGARRAAGRPRRYRGLGINAGTSIAQDVALEAVERGCIIGAVPHHRRIMARSEFAGKS